MAQTPFVVWPLISAPAFLSDAGQRFETAVEATDADGMPLLCIHSLGLQYCVAFRLHDRTVTCHLANHKISRTSALV